MPGVTHRLDPELSGHLDQPGHRGIDRGIADAVEAARHPGLRALAEVVGDLLDGEIAGTGLSRVRVRFAQPGCPRADRAVHAQVSGQSTDAVGPDRLDQGRRRRFAPVRHHVLARLGAGRGHPLQVLVRTQVRATQLVQRADPQLRRPAQSRPRGGPPIAVGVQTVHHDPAAMVRLLADEPVGPEAHLGRQPRDPVGEAGRDDRGVDVDPSEVDRHPRSPGPIQLGPARRPRIRPRRARPILDRTTRPGRRRTGGRRPRPAPPRGCALRADRDPAPPARSARVHVRVDEGRGHQTTAKIDPGDLIADHRPRARRRPAATIRPSPMTTAVASGRPGLRIRPECRSRRTTPGRSRAGSRTPSTAPWWCASSTSPRRGSGPAGTPGPTWSRPAPSAGSSARRRPSSRR